MDNKELLQQAAEKIKSLKYQLAEKKSDDLIAIVSAACRFPRGADTPEIFWEMILRGEDPIEDLSPKRWETVALSEDIKKKFPGTQWGGLIENVDKFDADFFGMGAIEATALDPQQRMLLEVSWEAFERAGMTAQRLMKSRTGVFIGMVGLDYKYRVEEKEPKEMHIYDSTGNALCTTSGRLSYAFGLEGPSMTIETACSSSLVTMHQACLSLRAKDCDTALVGASNLILSPKTMNLIGVTGALSPDGRCRTFDEKANGFVRSEGCGVVLLKRFSDAKRDGDRILGIIRGSAVNQDGRSTGFTAPNVFSQQGLLKAALKNAGLENRDISYIEAHGTGTSLGDPIELEAIKAVFNHPKHNSPIRVGSVKSNIGHLEAAAGMAGIIKITQMFANEKIPAQLHFTKLNPHIHLDEREFEIPTKVLPWERGHVKRIAGVSSFGFSGTNAHFIIEEPPVNEGGHEETPRDVSHLLLLSARTKQALADLVEKYIQSLEFGPLRMQSLSDICYSAANNRTHYEYRTSAKGRSHHELIEQLSKLTVDDFSKVSRKFEDYVDGMTNLSFVEASFKEGKIIDFSSIYKGRSVAAFLPTYPWQHESYWLPEAYRSRQLNNAWVKEAAPDHYHKPKELKETINFYVAASLGLKPNKIRTDQHLFEIGIDSISAANIINSLKNEAGISIELADILREGSIDNIVNWLEKTTPPRRIEKIEAINDDDNWGWDQDLMEELSDQEIEALREAVNEVGK